MRSQAAEKNTMKGTMNLIEQTEARRQHAQRRLNELELAAGSGGKLDLAWHMTQAVRTGASLAEVADAVRRGMKMRGTPAIALTQCVHDVVNRVSHARGAS